LHGALRMNTRRGIGPFSTHRADSMVPFRKDWHRFFVACQDRYSLFCASPEPRRNPSLGPACVFRTSRIRPRRHVAIDLRKSKTIRPPCLTASSPGRNVPRRKTIRSFLRTIRAATSDGQSESISLNRAHAACVTVSIGFSQECKKVCKRHTEPANFRFPSRATLYGAMGAHATKRASISRRYHRPSLVPRSQDRSSLPSNGSWEQPAQTITNDK
jgi:hypothetical protein